MSNCPVCGLGKIVNEVSKHTFEYKGAMLSAQRTDGFCDSCGSEVLDAKLARENVRNLQRAKSAYDNLLSSEEILALRTKYHLTQKAAASLFGGGETAFAKYESGDITHNVSMDRLLRLSITNPHIILELAEIANVRLDRKVTNSLIELTLESFNDLVGYTSNNLRFNKVNFATHTETAANDNSIEDIYQNVVGLDFEFKKAVNA